MTSEKNDVSKKETSSKSKKNIVILLVLLIVCSAAGVIFFKKSPDEKQEVVEVIPAKEELELDDVQNDSVIEIDSLILADSVTTEPPPEVVKPIIKKPKLKITKSQLDNNPKYWKIVKSTTKDTSFYILKNYKTGTKLFNRYYTEEKAEIELKKFKNIITQ